MNITNVRVQLVNGDNKLKAFVTVILNEDFALRELKIIQGEERLFVAMPAKRMKDGSFKDLVHPLNNKTRQYLEETVLEAYNQKLDEE